MSEFVNSVTEVQMKLHADMRRDTDIRWSTLPVEDHPAVKRRRRFHWLLAIPLAGVIAISILRWAAGGGPFPF